jgi:hypothetical protein
MPSVDGFEQFEQLYLTLASTQNANNLAAAQVEGREQLQRTLARNLVLQQCGVIARLRGLRFVRPGPGVAARSSRPASRQPRHPRVAACKDP